MELKLFGNYDVGAKNIREQKERSDVLKKQDLVYQATDWGEDEIENPRHGQPFGHVFLGWCSFPALSTLAKNGAATSVDQPTRLLRCSKKSRPAFNFPCNNIEYRT